MTQEHLGKNANDILARQLIAYLDYLVVEKHKPIYLIEREYKIRNMYSRLREGYLPTIPHLMRLVEGEGYTTLIDFLNKLEEYSVTK